MTMETTSYYQSLFNYLSNQHGVHLLESDMCEIINIVSNMKKQQRIAILESEIARLKVANRTTNERLEVLISHLAKQHRGANFSKLNPSEIPNSCDPFKPEAPECVANNGVANEGHLREHIDNFFNPIADNAIKSFEAKIMQEYGEMKSGEPKQVNREDIANGMVNIMVDVQNAVEPIKPDFTHLLPDGYEFCQEEDAVKWVKVEKLDVNDNDEYPIGHIENFTCFKGRWRPIRPIQYKVTTHEIVTAVPDPYMPDWSKAPEGAVAHAWDMDGRGFWCMVNIDEYMEWVLRHKLSNLTLPPDLDWRQSLRVKPSK
jgi:uncharacterized small protein (DUF1192 family)